MAEYKSDVKKIYYPVERVYDRLSDLNKLAVIQQNLDNPMIREKMLEQAGEKGYIIGRTEAGEKGVKLC